jgi:hypothetical protein
LSKTCIKIFAQSAENVSIQTTELLTPAELAYTLDISEFTFQSLVHYGKIPCVYTQIPGSQDKALRFDPYVITEWMLSNPQLDSFTSKNYIEGLKEQYKTRFPNVLRSLHAVNAQFSPPQKEKGYSLSKVRSKKYGFLYYVRYIELNLTHIFSTFLKRWYLKRWY